MRTIRSRVMRVLGTLGWLTVMSAFAVLVFAASLYITVRMVFVGRELAVPDVRELSLDEARAVLNRSDLYLEVASERFDETVTPGAVRSQDPEAGAKIKANRKVRVSISLGAVEVEIPDVRGDTLRTAQITLQREGLPVGHVTFTHEPTVPPDVVIAQDPLPSVNSDEDEEGDNNEEAGRLGWDGRVDLLVSRGPPEEQFVMPDLTHRPLSEVRAFASKVGLRVGAVRRERVPGLEGGRVVRQYPRAGYPIGKHDIISLVLSD